MVATVDKARVNLKQLKAHYKRNFHARIRKGNQGVQSGDYVYLDFKHGKGKDKLDGHTEGPFLVLGRTERTFVIQRNKVVERVNSYRDTKAPAPDNVSLREELDSIPEDGREKCHGTRLLSQGDPRPHSLRRNRHINDRLGRGLRTHMGTKKEIFWRADISLPLCSATKKLRFRIGLGAWVKWLGRNLDRFSALISDLGPELWVMSLRYWEIASPHRINSYSQGDPSGMCPREISLLWSPGILEKHLSVFATVRGHHMSTDD